MKQPNPISPVLITSAVKPASTSDTNLTSACARLHQCRDAIADLLEKRLFGYYVIVDGSNVEIFDQTEIDALAIKYGVQIEQLAFQQESEKVRLQGKSYGELAIIFYALNHSKLMKEFGSFTKISGRYSITNLHDVLLKVNHLKNFFFFDNPIFFNLNKKYTCTIVYRCETEFFQKAFNRTMEECSYDKNGFLESIFYRRLAPLNKKGVRVQFPYYTGISGVTGESIINSKYFFRNVLSKAGILCHTF